jgi:hypothetical protein
MSRGVNNLLCFYLQRLTDIDAKPVINIRLVSKKLAINHNWYWFLANKQIYMLLGAKLQGCRYACDRITWHNLDKLQHIYGLHCIKHRYDDIKFTAKYNVGHRKLGYKLKMGFMSYLAEIRPVGLTDNVLFYPSTAYDGLCCLEAIITVSFRGIVIIDTEAKIRNLDEFIAWVIKYRKK